MTRFLLSVDQSLTRKRTTRVIWNANQGPLSRTSVTGWGRATYTCTVVKGNSWRHSLSSNWYQFCSQSGVNHRAFRHRNYCQIIVAELTGQRPYLCYLDDCSKNNQGGLTCYKIKPKEVIACKYCESISLSSLPLKTIQQLEPNLLSGFLPATIEKIKLKTAGIPSKY